MKPSFNTRYMAIINRKNGECVTVKHDTKFVNYTWDEYGKLKEKRRNENGTR